MSEVPEVKQSRADFYESKRKDYMLPPDDSIVEMFTITSSTQATSVSELLRQVAATMTAFWQADGAYCELKQHMAELGRERDEIKRQHDLIFELPSSKYIRELEAECDTLKAKLADEELVFNHGNELVGKLEADIAALRAKVERLSAPVTDEE